MSNHSIRIEPEVTEALSIWFYLAKKEGYDPGDNLRCNIDHSSLLSRLLNNGPVFKKAPPKAYSYPWVELLEHGKDILWESRAYLKTDSEEGSCLNLAQYRWLIVEEGENWYIVQNGDWRVKAEIRDQLITDGVWSRNITEEEKIEIVRKSNEEKCIVEVTLLNPDSDREQINEES